MIRRVRMYIVYRIVKLIGILSDLALLVLPGNDVSYLGIELEEKQENG